MPWRGVLLMLNCCMADSYPQAYKVTPKTIAAENLDAANCCEACEILRAIGHSSIEFASCGIQAKCVPHRLHAMQGVWRFKLASRLKPLASRELI